MRRIMLNNTDFTLQPHNWVELYTINRTTMPSVQYWEIDLSSNTNYYRIYKYYTEYVFSGNYWLFDEIILEGIDEDGNTWTNSHISKNGKLGKYNQLTCWTDVEQEHTAYIVGAMDVCRLFDGIYGDSWHNWFHSVNMGSSNINGNIIFSLPKPICIKKITIWDQWDGYDPYTNRNTKIGCIYGDTNNM